MSRRIEITVDREVASVFVQGQPSRGPAVPELAEGLADHKSAELPGDFESLLRIASELHAKK